MCGTPPPTITIFIAAINAAPFPPAITDGTNFVYSETDDQNLTTTAKSGTIVIFKKAGDISAIISVDEVGGQNVFSTNPSPQPDGSWKGVIGSLPPNSEESYSISYRINGLTYTQDPKIRINQ